MVNNLGPAPMKVKLGESSKTPILTLMLILSCILVFFVANSGNRPTTWLTDNTLKPDAVLGLINDHDYAKLATTLIYSNFATLAIWQMLLSMYFFALFGIGTEKTLGTARFFILVLLGCTIPWAVLTWDITNVRLALLPWEHTYKGSLNFFSPNLLIFTIIGAYLVVVPDKKVPFSERRGRARGEIHNSVHTRPVSERFGLKPRTFAIAFTALAFAFHVALSFYWSDSFGATTLSSALIAAGIGYTFAATFLASAVETFKDSPLKQKALKHYYELVALDISSADAIRGTARALGLPVEQVSMWVASGKGKMRVTTDR
jgi:membrane associated rhomboid family serine protease